MIFDYHADTDMLYVRLHQGVSVESEEVAPGVVLDFDDANRVIGVELEHASKFLNLSRLDLRSLPISDLVVRERAPAAT
jgi:uncharacterized protein YuzE